MRREKAPPQEIQLLNSTERVPLNHVVLPTLVGKEFSLPFIASEVRFASNGTVDTPPAVEVPKVPKEYRRLRDEGMLSLASSIALVFFSTNVLPYLLLPAFAGFALGRFIQSIKYEPRHLSGYSLMISLLSAWCLYNAGSMFWPLLFAGTVPAVIAGSIFLSAAMALLIGANARSIVALFKGRE